MTSQEAIFKAVQLKTSYNTINQALNWNSNQLNTYIHTRIQTIEHRNNRKLKQMKLENRPACWLQRQQHAWWHSKHDQCGHGRTYGACPCGWIRSPWRRHSRRPWRSGGRWIDGSDPSCGRGGRRDLWFSHEHHDRQAFFRVSVFSAEWYKSVEEKGEIERRVGFLGFPWGSVFWAFWAWSWTGLFGWLVGWWADWVFG